MAYDMPTEREQFLTILETAFERIGAASRIPGTVNERIMRINAAETLARSVVRRQLRAAAGGNIPPLLCPVLADALRLVSRVAEKYRKAATDHAASPVTGAQASFLPLCLERTAHMGIENFSITATERRHAMANVRASLNGVANHPLLTADVDVVVAALANLSPEDLKTQLRHQLVLAREWHMIASRLAEEAEKSVDREALAYTAAAGAHNLAADAHKITASALEIAAGKAA